MAICLALKPSFLLLDEVTSALDHEAALKVERLLKESKAACIWVTHEDAQVSRVGGRCLQLPLGTEVLSMATPAFRNALRKHPWQQKKHIVHASRDTVQSTVIMYTTSKSSLLCNQACRSQKGGILP